jgi:hypothetical protein
MSNEQDKIKHSTRLHRAWNTIKRQLKIARSIGNTKYIDQPHRLVKHHAADCGQPGCLMCANPRHNASVKGKDRLTVQERRDNQKGSDTE